MEHLVAQFEYQLSVGCGKQDCPVSWCLAHRKNASKKPLRPLTKLSTRALAVHLATLPDAQTRLCTEDALATVASRDGACRLKDAKSFVQHVFDGEALRDIDVQLSKINIHQHHHHPPRPYAPFKTSADSDSLPDAHRAFDLIIAAVHDHWLGDGFRRPMSEDILSLLSYVDSRPLDSSKAMLMCLWEPYQIRDDMIGSPSALVEDWLATPSGTKHVLEYPWLFTTACQAVHFRAICIRELSRMSSSAELHRKLMGQSYALIAAGPSASVRNTTVGQYFHRIRSAGTAFLCIQVRRETILEDSFDQLWGKESHVLRLPLKVKILDEGEEGLDHGGVAQEYLNLVFSELLDPKRGLFVTDETSGMAWFDPRSTEQPRYYFFIGLLIGIAVLNGFTLPVRFSSTMYRTLLADFRERRCEELIREGWPDLHNNFAKLLQMDESQGKLEDVLCRPYAFNIRTFDGRDVEIDMTRYSRLDGSWKEWRELLEPSATTVTAVQPPLVGLGNRHQFVKDYSLWLVYISVFDQVEACSEGFRALFSKRSLRALTPQCLQIITEGNGAIDVGELERVTQYENYDRDEPIIQGFWEIVRGYTPERIRALLKFVTASDRVPATGVGNLRFKIVRNGYADSEHLPTASTCFGYLMLPPYSSNEIMRRKLDAAIDEPIGFGLT